MRNIFKKKEIAEVIPTEAVPSEVEAPVAITKFQFYYAYGLITSLFFLWGFSYGLLDVLNKHIQQVFGISRLQSTGLQIAYFGGGYFLYSPFAGWVMSKIGYKKGGVYHGLTLYCIGALSFWPSSVYKSFAGFVVSAFIIGCGLATLEVVANSYVTVLGPAKDAAMRLNFSQAFNGVASFCGPLIASKYFFGSEEAKNSLGAVQYVYVAVAGMGALVMVLFFFAYLPEITNDDMARKQAADGYVDERPLWKRKHTILGFVSQFFYVGAQVTFATFIINYLSDTGTYSTQQSAQLFSYMQITFMVARFASVPVVKFFNPAHVLIVYGTMCTIFSIVAATVGGRAGLASLFIVFFFESAIYPTTFTLATSNLGVHTKQGAALVVQGVGGAALMSPLQGLFADSKGTEISYIVPAIGFAVVVCYGLGMTFYTARFARARDANLAAEGGMARVDSTDKASVEAEKIEAPVLRA